MNFEIAIALQLFDNFSRQLFQAKESLDRFNKGLAESQNRLKSLSEIMKKAFDPKAIWEASEKGGELFSTDCTGNRPSPCRYDKDAQGLFISRECPCRDGSGIHDKDWTSERDRVHKQADRRTRHKTSWKCRRLLQGGNCP